MASSQSFLEELLAVKKQQATALFGPWDTEDEGRIAVQQVRPLLMSVFPASASPAVPPFLTAERVRAAYESVARRPYQLPASVVTAARAAHHARRPRDPMYLGPTLDELHGIIDALAAQADDDQLRRAGSSAAATPRRRSSALQPLTGSASQSLRDTTPDDSFSDSTGIRSVGAGRPQELSKARPSLEKLLRGSLEHIYRQFCSAAAAPGESVVADGLPLDSAHLKRLSWTLQSRCLEAGEGHALRQLLAETAASRTDGAAGARVLSADAFVSLICAL